MEFHTQSTLTPPKHLFPCLATITLGAPTSRRLSGSAISNDDGADAGLGLRRVISGNRRRTSFGQAAVRGDTEHAQPRKSFDSGKAAGGGEVHEKGTWYWRVQAGVSDSHLVLLPLSNPPNPLLTSKPAPLSHVMPAHSTRPNAHTNTNTEGEKESIGDKIKNLFTGGGGAAHKKDTSAATGQGHAHDGMSTDTDVTAVDRITDQTPGGEQRGGDPNAEQGWPGVIHGQKLGAIVVSFHTVGVQGVMLGGGNKEGSWVTVPINAGFPGVGQTSESAPKSGSIKFEFDKEWIGAKGEAEVLHYQLVSALEKSQPGASGASPSVGTGGQSHFANQNFQLGGGHANPVNSSTNTNTGHHAGTGTTTGTGTGIGLALPIPAGSEIAPDESVGSTTGSGRSGKVAGEF